jgi:lysophospholipase L1-like esterase
MLHSWVPNLVELSRPVSRSARVPVSIGEIWKRQVAKRHALMSDADRARFSAIAGEIRVMFVEGRLSPGLLTTALSEPSAWRESIDLGSRRVRRGIRQLGTALEEIREAANAAGAALAVVSSPNGYFCSERVQQSYAQMGIEIAPDALSTRAMDEAIARAAARAGLDAFDLSDRFRREARARDLFFRYDGHFNRDGHRLFAEGIEEFVRAKLQSREPAAGARLLGR